MVADASQQERDQDLHDFIKRQAPKFRRLEVEYQEWANPSIELENKDEPDRVLRADVTGWKSGHLQDFLSSRLKPDDSEAGETNLPAKGAYTAEIQSCSG